MRMRKTLVALSLGATTGLGLMAAPAQAAPATAPAAKIAAASWHYLDLYESRYICENAARQFREQQGGTPTQCRGPYKNGVFQLWYWA